MNNVVFLLALLPACYRTEESLNYDMAKNGLVELTNTNLKATVLDQAEDWFVIFDGDMKLFNCAGNQKSYCDRVKVEVKLYEAAFVGLKASGFRIGRVDFTNAANNELTEKYPFVTGFPSYVIFGKHKDKPILFNYVLRTPQEIVEMVKFLNDKPLPASGQCGSTTGPSPNKGTYELNDENFNEVVLQCGDPWMVIFYPAGDAFPACNFFVQKFEEAAKTMQNRVQFGKFYNGLRTKVGSKYNSQNTACETVFFHAGDKSGQPEAYNNGITIPKLANGFVSFLEGRLG